MSSLQQNARLSFTIGPVQTFVAQARRTRDLWTGSWLLSFLSESALAAAENAGGTTLIPFRENPGVITSTNSAVGGIPNHFELRFDSKQMAVAAATAAENAFYTAWKKIADAVWNRYVLPVADMGNQTRSIWDRQVQNFWEVSWVVGTATEGDSPLGRLAAGRKNIRNTPSCVEPGVKCALMVGLQEISGYYGKKQRDFWKAVRKNTNSLDLRDEREHLSAIAMIKRFFPYVVGEALGENVGNELLLQEAWPSTAFMAASPWLFEVKDKASEKALEYFNVSGHGQSERGSAHDTGLHEKWAYLDAQAWFASSVREELKADPGKSKKVLNQLEELYSKVGKKPVPYYAMLLMDGDSMGKLVAAMKRKGTGATNLSKSLGEFSKKVDPIVRENHGRTIYAGGDDVLAILPARYAFQTAESLSIEYKKSFDDIEEATLSGSILFAHWRYPLRQVLLESHRLLDDIAKERTGRDSLAISVIQGSGLNAVWSAPWKFLSGEKPDVFGRFIEFTENFSIDREDSKTAKFSTSFLYTLRTLFTKLAEKPLGHSGTFSEITVDTELLVDVTNSEYRRRMSPGDKNTYTPEQTRKEMASLVALCQKWYRNEERNIDVAKNTFCFDGWKIARLMKQINYGKVNEHV